MKRDLVEAAVEVGFDGEGDQGLRGYLKYLAIRHPKCFSSMLGKVLPHYVSVDVNASVATIGEIRIISVPPDHYFPKGATERNLGQLEHIPPAELAAPAKPAPEQPPSLTELENKLLAMDPAQLLELAEKLGVGR